MVVRLKRKVYMTDVHLSSPNGVPNSERSIRGIVKSTYAKWHRPMIPVTSVNEDTSIPDDMVPRILEEVGEVLDLVIPPRSKPRHGWKVSTLVGYIFDEQNNFAPRKQK